MSQLKQPIDNLTPAQVKANAKEWYRRQCEVSAMALGPAWEKHRGWIEEYLRAEVRQRLIDRGWRPKA